MTLLMGLCVTTTVSVENDGAFWSVLLQMLASTSMGSSCLGFGSHQLILFARLSLSRGLLRPTRWASTYLILGFRTIWKLTRFLTCLRAIRPFCINVHLIAMPLARKTLLARAVHFAVDHLLSMDEVCARIFGADVPPGLTSHGMGGDLRNEELPTYPDDEGDDWDFADVPVILRSTFVPVFAGTSSLFSGYALNSVAVTKEACDVLSMSLQNLMLSRRAILR